MNQKARPIRLNLLPQDPFYETVPGRVLLWASTVGRYLVIFTELVVIISFATRFKLDKDLTDLNSSITQKVNLINSYGDLEDRVRTLQKKTAFLKDANAGMSTSDVLALLASAAPSDVVLDAIQFRDASVSFTGTALSSRSLAQYILALQAAPKISSVNVEQVKSAENGASGFTFSMRVLLEGQPAVAASPKPAAPAAATTEQAL